MDSGAHSPLWPQAEWHSRRCLPHWEAGEVPQTVTFRLADSLPRVVLAARSMRDTPSLRREHLEACLDTGHGEGLLARPGVSNIVQDALRYFDNSRYRLHAWCVMPNHVHVLFTPLNDASLSSIVHSWKSFTAKAINSRLARAGELWAGEYFDRAIRDDEHMSAATAYIEENPVKAGLCATAADWPCSSASEGGRLVRPA